jgi:hypothetical protein
MPSSSFYKVKTVSAKNKKITKNISIFNPKLRSKRKKQLIFSVLGLYVGVGVLLGSLLFGFQTPNSASEIVGLNAAIVMETDSRQSEYKLGNEISFRLTLQNTGTTESLNNVNINFYSTGKSLSFRSIQDVKNPGKFIEPDSQGVFNVSSIGVAGRMEFKINTTLIQNKLPQVFMWAEISFVNNEGQMLTKTDEEIVYDISDKVKESSLLSLKAEKTLYKPNEELKLVLNYLEDQKITGDVSVTDRNSLNPVFTTQCELENKGVCNQVVKDLPVGQYSAMFISKDQLLYSNILNFEVKGSGEDFIPFEGMSMKTPFGNSSKLGLYSIIFEDVLSLNQFVSGQECKVDIYFGKQKYTTINQLVDQDRNCRFDFSVQNLNKGNGQYTVKLANTDLSKTFNFFKKTEPLLKLNNLSSVVNLQSSLKVNIINILDLTTSTQSQPVYANNLGVSLVIYHTKSGEMKEVTSLNGKSLNVVNGVFEASIDPSYFNKGGFYQIYTILSDGQISDWLNIDFSNSDLGLADSDIQIFGGQFKIDKSNKLFVQNIQDRTGKIVASGACEIAFIDASNTKQIFDGEIDSGVCSVNISPNKITRTGLALVTAQAKGIQNYLPVSRYINVQPAAVNSFGQINFEYFPLKYETANRMLIGPVVDKYSNLLDLYNLQLNLITKKDGQKNILKSKKDISVDQGYAQISLPQSWFNQDIVTFELVDYNGKTVLEGQYPVIKNDLAVTKASFLQSTQNSTDFKAKVTGLEEYANQLYDDYFVKNQNLAEKDKKYPNFKCSLELIYTKDKKESQEQAYVDSEDSCDFVFQRKLGEKDKILAKIKFEKYTWMEIVQINSAKPNNLFEITPSLYSTNTQELELNLLTSPILDAFGKVISSGQIRWKVNGKDYTSEIKNGVSSLQILSGDLSLKDFKNLTEDTKALKLDISATASVTSISSTNTLEVYVGNKLITNTKSKSEVMEAQNYLNIGQSYIFTFKSNNCSAYQITENNQSSVISHYLAGKCYVQITAQTGKNSILIQNKGKDLVAYEAYGSDNWRSVNWCENEGTCKIQVLDDSIYNLQVEIVDGANLYKFKPEKDANTVFVSQAGLNPIQNYQVKVRYEDQKGQKKEFIKFIPGEYLLEVK